MKKIEDWLKTIEDVEIRNAAWSNRYFYPTPATTADSASQAISKAFIWKDTPEGYMYWKEAWTKVFSTQPRKDKIVQAVRNDLKERSKRGIKKYGTTLDRKDLELKDWLQHAYEESLDKSLYLKKAISLL